MKNTLTEALIYENQGLREEALEIYKKILADDPENFDAKAGLRRVEISKRMSVNSVMLDFFLNLKSDEEIREFKRWLIKI